MEFPLYESKHHCIQGSSAYWVHPGQRSSAYWVHPRQMLFFNFLLPSYSVLCLVCFLNRDSHSPGWTQIHQVDEDSLELLTLLPLPLECWDYRILWGAGMEPRSLGMLATASAPKPSSIRETSVPLQKPQGNIGKKS